MNIRLTILLVFVLVIFGGTFLWFRFNPREEPAPTQPWLYRIDDSTIVHIEATHDGKTTIYDRKPGGTTWYIQEDGKETPVYIEKWSGTPLLLSGPQVNRVLAQSIDDPAKYGLDPPKSVIKVTERSGIVYEFHMGDPTPSEQNQYARLVGDPQLFSVPQIWALVINRLATEPPYPRLYFVEADSPVVAFDVKHNGREVTYFRRPGSLNWFALEDREIPVAQDRFGEILQSINNPPIAEVLMDELDSPGDYGLELPQTTVQLEIRGETPTVFFLGSVTPDGNSRYAFRRGREQLFAVPESWAMMLEGLVTQPPYSTVEAEVPGSTG